MLSPAHVATATPQPLPPATFAWTATALGLVTSDAEHAGKIYIGRDGGYSIRLDALGSLWLFGDTLVRGPAPASKILSFSPGSSAAVGPSGLSQLATGLREVVPDVGIAPALNKPARQAFIPNPKATYLPGGAGSCSQGAGRFGARWPTGAARLGASLNVLISYVDVCVIGSLTTVEGFGVAIWSAKTFHYVLPPTDLIAPSPSGRALDLGSIWTSPIVEPDGSIDFFSTTSDPAQPGTSIVRSAHVAKDASLTNLSSYVARTLRGPLNGSFPGRLLHFAAYPGAKAGSVLYRAIGSRFVLGTATVSSSSSLTGPWVDNGAAQLPDCPRPKGSFCWSLIGHPEMSAASSLVVSYYSPGTASDFGHIRLLRLTPTPTPVTSTTSTTSTTQPASTTTTTRPASTTTTTRPASTTTTTTSRPPLTTTTTRPASTTTTTRRA